MTVEQPTGCLPLLVGLLTMLATMLCGGLVISETAANPNPPSVMVEPALPNSLLSQLDEAETQWQAAGISSYTISVTDASFWSVQTNTITVEDGVIIDQSATCINSPMQQDGACQPKPFDPAAYTVSGLFEHARSSAAIDEGLYTTITFDPEFHFPSSIGFDNPEILDEQWIITVESFEVSD
ncbi:MAG TPA: DUF6174 domain-containing protein [Aggregatilineaceae bacterium]|nr:DUF6174 domain-containing protein [Aggregatilineaceae bacterium]